MQGEPLNLGRDLRVLGHERTALDRGDVLGDVERERREVAERADPAPAPLRPDRVRRVLNHPQPVAVAQLSEPVHVDRAPREVDRHDRPRAWRDCGLGGVQVDQPGSGNGIDEHRGGSSVLDRVRRRDEGHRGDQNLVPGPDAEHLQGEDQRCGARGQAPALGHAEVIGEHPLEALHLGAGPDPARTERVDDLGDLLLADHRAPEDQKAFPHAGVTVVRRSSRGRPRPT